MKRIFKYLVLMIGVLLVAVGCENKTPKYNERKPDHKIYKYVKITSSVGNDLIVPIEYIIGSTSEVGHLDDIYAPTLLAEFDTTTGKATSVKFYSFYLDYEDDEWVNKALNEYKSSSSSYKDDITNVKKGRVNDNVSYLEATINPDSYVYEQYVGDIIKYQDIEKYKKDVYYDNLYNYSTTPEVKDKDGYFWDALTGRTVIYSDNKIKAY